MRLAIASGNPGKLREIEPWLAPLGIEAVAQASLGIAEAEEPHDTFVENALAKARHASQHAGLPALADDSGICVSALQGKPGVHSARFAGEGGDLHAVFPGRRGAAAQPRSGRSGYSSSMVTSGR